MTVAGSEEIQCRKCGKGNDDDALFCEQCGSALPEKGSPKSLWSRASTRASILLLVALAVAAGAGYYRFILPRGIAAEVNGEKITLAEVDRLARSAVPGGDPAPESAGRMRYVILSRLITERIAEQEARKAGTRANPEEVEAAVADAQASLHMDHDRFEKQMSEQYGSMRAFSRMVERQLVVRKFIAERLAPGLDDPALVNAKVEQWLQNAAGKATVRISLDEQLPRSGCGCCGGSAGSAGGCDPSQPRGAGAAVAAHRAAVAKKAAMDYWQRHGGSGPVEAKVTDLGCHLQIDMVKGTVIARSLRYQNGIISEQ